MINFVAKAIITVAMSALQMALQASQTIEGPRLTDLKTTTANPGDVLPNGLGQVRNSGLCNWAEPIKEKKKKHKTKGGKYKEYTYFGTWAIIIADHPIARVRRIWFDNHLVWKNDGTTTTSVGDGNDEIENLTGDNVRLQDLIRIYDGTQTEPDPRMLATIEAKYGVGTCPAWLNISYMVLEDVPLAKVGNRLPMVDVEYDGVGGSSAIGASTFDVLDSLLSDPDYNGFTPSSLSPDGRYLISNVYKGILTVDQTDNSVTTAFDPSGVDSWAAMAIDNDTTVYALQSAVSGTLYSLGAFANGAHTLLDNSAAEVPAANSLQLFTVAGAKKLVWADGGGSFDINVYDITTDTRITVASSNGGNLVHQLVQDSHGDVWAVSAFGSTKLSFQRVVNGGSGSAAPNYNEITLPAYGASASVEAYHAASGHWFVKWAGGRDLYLFDEDDFSTLAHRSYGATGSNLSATTASASPFLLGLSPGSSEFWYPSAASFDADRFQAVDKIRASDLSSTQSVPTADWGIGDLPDFNLGMVYTTYTQDKLVSQDIQSGSPYRFAPVFRYFAAEEGALSLGDVVRYFSGLVNLTAGTDYTVAAGVDAIPVLGYGWTQGPAKSHVDWQLDINDCEVRTHDGIPDFITRGGSPGSTIQTADMVIPEGKPQERYKLPVVNETDLPRRIVFTFADADADLQPNTAKSQRNLNAFDGRSEITIDGSTLTLGADDAQAKVDRFFRRKHFTLQKAEDRLSARHLAIETGDVHPIDFDGVTITMHADKITDSADGSRHIEWSIDNPAIATAPTTVGAPVAGRPPSEIFSPGLSTGVVLDIPLISDAHDQVAPFAYFGGGPVDDVQTYVGTEISASDTGDDETYALWDATGSSDPMTYGTVATATGLSVLPWVWDTGSTLQVVLNTGTLSGVTADQILDNGALNLFAYGAPGRWILGQFRTPTLTAPLTYAITNILWGVRGTEHLIGTQEDGDQFILLDSAIGRHLMGASEVGDTDWYIAAAAGATPNPANEFDIDFAANAHRPYAPVHGLLSLDTGSGDWSIDATRRTRIGGSALNGQDVPLGEASEAWQADIYDGATFKRTLSGTALPLIYSAADQTTDFGAPVTSGFEVNLYQMNPTLNLRGTPLALAA